jgi:hypothetical protein
MTTFDSWGRSDRDKVVNVRHPDPGAVTTVFGDADDNLPLRHRIRSGRGSHETAVGGRSRRQKRSDLSGAGGARTRDLRIRNPSILTVPVIA